MKFAFAPSPLVGDNQRLARLPGLVEWLVVHQGWGEGYVG